MVGGKGGGRREGKGRGGGEGAEKAKKYQYDLWRRYRHDYFHLSLEGWGGGKEA